MAERNEKGQYIKGHSGNPGGRKAHNDYAAIIRATCDAEDWAVIVKKAVTDAKAGDRFARRFLADYLLGRPVQHIEMAEVAPLSDDLQNKLDKVYGTG